VGDRSLKISLLARRLAESEGCSSFAIGDAACAALLSHIGTIVLMARRPEAFRALSLQLDAGNGTLQAEESARFGASHAAVGAYLLGLWGFNDNIVEAVAFHHQPAASEVHQPGALALLHVAQALAVAEQDPALLDGRIAERLDMGFLAEAGLADRLPAWIDIARHLLAQWHR
jgi:HD-like signal output (HDOD) protein